MADDFASTPATTGRLAIGTPSGGNIDSATDVDWFRITLAKDQVVQLDLVSNTGAAKPLHDPLLVGVYTSAGVLLPDTGDDDGGAGLNAQLQFKAPAAGDYFVAAGTSDGLLGAYLLSATDQTPPPPVLSIEALNPVQPEGNQGSTLMRFTVTRDGELGAASSAAWSVHPSGATPATAADFGLSALPSGTVNFAPGQDSATIEIAVPGDTRYEHDASFSVALSAPAGATLGGLDGGTSIAVSASADYGVTEQFFRLTGNSGAFTVTSGTRSEPLAVAIYVNGTLAIDSASDGAYAGTLAIPNSVQLHAGDVVAVVTTGTAGQSDWDYTVDYWAGVERAAYVASAVIVDNDPAPDDNPASSATKAALAIGGAFAGRIDNGGDVDWIAVSLVAGQSYVFNLDAAAAHGLANPALDLYNAAGKLLASDDNGGAGFAAQLTVSVDTSGVYYLAASASDGLTGNYLLYGAFDVPRADDFSADANTSGRIAVGASAGGRIETAGDHDWFAISLDALTQYQFSIVPGHVDGLVQPALAVYGSSPAPLASADASGKLVFSPAAAGTYYLSASGPATGTGNYTIDAAAAGVTPPVDTEAPVLTSSTPGRGNSSDMAPDASIKLVFSEAMARGAGAIEIRNIDGTIADAFDAATSSRITIDGNTIFIDPPAALPADGYYRLSVGMGAFTDLAGNPVKGGVRLAFSTTAAGPATTTGTAGNDLLKGTSGNDSFTGSGGNDVIDGGAGFDQLRYAGKRADYAFTPGADGALLVRKPGGGTDTLSHIERLVFDDGIRSLDLDGTAGQVYRIYQAAFNRVPDQQGLGYWITNAEHGVSLRDVASGFVASSEFQGLFGGAAPSNAQLVNRIYENVLHRPADAGGFAYWVGALDSHASTTTDVLMGFSESQENRAAVIGAISLGIDYLPFG